MKGAFGLVLAAITATFSGVVAKPVFRATTAGIVVKPGTVEQMAITELNTINGTQVEDPITTVANSMTIRVHHNFDSSSRLYAYVTGLDRNNAPCFLQSNNQFYYPSASDPSVPSKITGNIRIPLSSKGGFVDVTVPDTLSSGRVYISEGELVFSALQTNNGVGVTVVQPSFANSNDINADKRWGFVEFTLNDGGVYANISFVDFVGMVFSMTLTLGSGATQQVTGLDSTAIPNICQGLQAQTARDGQSWAKLCMYRSDGTPLRVLAPNIFSDTNRDFDSYYNNYVNQVWSKYASQDLTIATQGSWGNVPCRVSSDNMLYCRGDSKGFPKPTTRDIFGCNSGPFANIPNGDSPHLAIVARLCAAFHRTELLLQGGNLTPSLGSGSYYTADPTSHYARLVHQHEVDGKGYAFSYDDVNVGGENAAGVVAGAGPKMLEVWAGGRS